MTPSMTEPFTGPAYRIQLRPIRTDDVDALLTWVNDPDVTRNFAAMSEPITRQRELAFVEGVLASETDALFAIEDRDGHILGTAGIHKIFWPARNGRLGLILGRAEARGTGLGQEAMKLVTALGFRTLGLHKVWVVHYASNARMHHIVQKLGFVPEGTLRDEYYHREAFHDMARHAMLEHEFEAVSEAWGLPSPAAP